MTISFLDDARYSNRVTAPVAPILDAPADPEGGFGLADIGRLMKRRRALIMLFVLIGTLASAAAAIVVPKTYTATSTIVLRPDDPNLLEDRLDQQSLVPASRAQMDTQADLIRSRLFTGRVVDALNLVQDARFNTYLETPATASAADLEPAVLTAVRTWLAGAVTALIGDDEVQPGALPDRSVQRDRAISVLLSMMAVSRNGESLAMNISISNEDADTAALIANSIARLYVDWSREQKQGEARDGAKFLRKQATELAARIASLEKQIADFGSEEAVSADPRDDLLRAAIQQVNEQLGVARADLSQARSKLAEYTNRQDGATRGPDSTLPKGETTLTSPFLDTLRADLATALKERAELTRNYGSAHPLMLESDAKIRTIRAQISDETRRIVSTMANDVDVAEGRVKRLGTELANLNGRLAARGRADIRLRELQRDLLTEQKLYDVVSDKLGKVDPYSDVVQANARVVSLAAVPTTATPTIKVVIAGGFVGSLVLAVILALTMDGVDRRVWDGEHAARLAGLPLVGVLPRLQRRLFSRQRVLADLRDRPRSAFAEGFRLILDSVRRDWNDSPTQTLLVSSPLPGEGKTTVAFGLAVAAATRGLRTALIDFDLSAATASPTRQELDGLVHPVESDGPISVGAVEGIANLQIYLPNNAAGTGILDRDAVARHIQACRATYDFVVIDGPPLLVVEEVISLAKLVDTSVLVAAWGQSFDHELAEARETIRRHHVGCCGLVLNGVDPNSAENGVLRTSRQYRRRFARYFNG
ncbi:exopolysaccharide transport family protein [Jiella sp. MQZ9-1]|uniref:Uncharacterized protein n=1 Tax=Jiella flava TaxID=2816857 RepID=A0A939FWZ1_9HYPH|nr:exopolysaccharide transport family protein [Jiella flava]MBO0663042.1 hypothetical protein [Jiella flava]MCD2471461.1 exopolysaccharide transport family protein [Jiella flava]